MNLKGTKFQKKVWNYLKKIQPEEVFYMHGEIVLRANWDQNEIFIETRDNVLSQYIQLNSVLVRDVTLPTAIKEGIVPGERAVAQSRCILPGYLPDATRVDILVSSGKRAALPTLNAPSLS